MDPPVWYIRWKYARKSLAGNWIREIHVECSLGITGLLVIEWRSKNAAFNSQYFCDTIITMLVHDPFSQGPVTVWHYWMIHLDNARRHTSKESIAFMPGQKLTKFSHPPYSPDITLSNFYLIDNIKIRLRECHGKKFEEIQSNMTEMLTSISGEELFGMFCEWKKRLEHIITISRTYV
jgi:hypothetical protein